MGKKRGEWKERLGAWLGHFWKKWKTPLIVGAIFLLLLALLGISVWLGWVESGFELWHPPQDGDARPKTAWDIADLCLVPLILAASAALFTWWTNKEQQKIEMDRTSEAALQAYLDRMAELIKDGLGESALGDAKRTIARARTLTVLQQLDGERKGLLLRFLYESGLIGHMISMRRADTIINLERADLSEANLHGAVLWGAHLEGVDLRRADLSQASLDLTLLRKANLSRANFSGATMSVEDHSPTGVGVDGPDLSEANLTGADLTGARLGASHVYHIDMSRSWNPMSKEEEERVKRHGGLLFANGTNLSKANLTGAQLVGANLFEGNLCEAILVGADLSDAWLEEVSLLRADLTGAKLEGANLSYADLTNARVSDKQLAQAKSLEGATLPTSPGTQAKGIRMM